jgi:hypothetical protein
MHWLVGRAPPTSCKAKGQAAALALAGGPWGPASRAAAADATISPLSCRRRSGGWYTW